MGNEDALFNEMPPSSRINIEVTQEMVQAGLAELRCRAFGDDFCLLVEDIYRAMAYEDPNRISASNISFST